MFQTEEMPKYQIAYMRQMGPYGLGNKELMEKMKTWAKANSLYTDTAIILGIAHDNPAVTPPEHCRYDVCVVVSEDFHAEDECVNIVEFSGGR